MNATFDHARVQGRWRAVWQELGAPGTPPEVLADLVRAYSSPDRYYHTLAHIEDCLSLFDQTRHLATRPGEVELAIWFHDAVYDPQRSDNEQKSAEWAGAVIRQAGLGEEIAQRVSDSILATRHRGEPAGEDARLLVDVDLSILGKDPDDFWQYEENIPREYARVAEALFRQERAKVLKRFLDREQIYYHAEYRERFEARARTNLRQAIDRLAG